MESQDGTGLESARFRHSAAPGRYLTLAFLITALLGASGANAGGIYTYRDERGVVHFTNVRGDARYRPIKSRLSGLRVIAPPIETHRFDGLIGQTARQHRVQPALVKAVIAAESNFNPDAVSRVGAQGLMQLMPATAASLGVLDPLEPDSNVRGGVAYLRAMLDRYGELEPALAAYNAGPTSVDRYGGIPPFPETQDYVQRVLTYYRHYHDDFRR